MGGLVHLILTFVGIVVDVLNWLSWQFVYYDWQIVALASAVGFLLPSPLFRRAAILQRVGVALVFLGASSFGVFLSVARHAADLYWLTPAQLHAIHHVKALHWTAPSVPNAPFGIGTALNTALGKMSTGVNSIGKLGADAVNQVALINPRVEALKASGKVMEVYGALAIAGLVIGIIVLFLALIPLLRKLVKGISWVLQYKAELTQFLFWLRANVHDLARLVEERKALDQPPSPGQQPYPSSDNTMPGGLHWQ